jgi:hypothetical protein
MFYKDSDPGTAFWVIPDPDPTHVNKDNMDNFTVRASKKYSKLYVSKNRSGFGSGS